MGVLKQAASALCALALSVTEVQASTLNTLYSIKASPDGTHPQAGLTDVGGVLYGVSTIGGIYGHGVVFKIDPASGAEEVVYTFTGGNDGDRPASRLTSVGGVLFGSTLLGGPFNAGVVFKLDPASGTETVLHAFGSGSDGAYPVGALVGAGGLLYGATGGGGASGNGTVFAIDPSSGNETILHAFQAGGDGQYPTDLIVQGHVIFGTTSQGGTPNAGTVFQINPITGAEAIIYSLNGGNDGTGPVGLAAVGDNFFVTVQSGGAAGGGTVLKVSPSTGAESVVHSFGSEADGTAPTGALTKVGGTLYGTTQYGGVANLGTIYTLNPSTGRESVLYAFTGNFDGALPNDPIIALEGKLYGTTYEGGIYGYYAGTAFSFDPAAGALSVLHSFTAEPGTLSGEGLLNVKGNLYVTQAQGGPVGRGAILKIDPATGNAQTVNGFTSPNDGAAPEAAMIRVGGTLYGTTVIGGSSLRGTVFKLNPVTNAATVLHSFAGGSDGRDPFSPLLFLKNALYGTTYTGGAQSAGTLYKVDPATGAATILHSFGGAGDGQNPYAGLIDVRGVLYGTTLNTIYKFDPATGLETTLYTFTGESLAYPSTLLKVGTLFYGTTVYSGAHDAGTLFSFDPATNALTVLHDFSGSEGAYPAEPLTVWEGSLYGTAQAGGSSDSGTLFKINASGAAFNVLYNFANGGDGGAPCSPLVAIGSTLYGGTCTGGAENLGTIFDLQP